MIEALGEDGSLSVGKEVATTPAFRLESLEAIRVKGKSAALAVFAVHRASALLPKTEPLPQAVA